MHKTNGLMLGVLAGTLIASTCALMGKRQPLIKKFSNRTQEWIDKAKNIKENLYDDLYELAESKRSLRRKNFVGGALLGLLLGAGSAALLTPKNGKQLRRELTNRYLDVSDKTHDFINYINHNGYKRPLRKLSRALAAKRRSYHRTRP